MTSPASNSLVVAAPAGRMPLRWHRLAALLALLSLSLGAAPLQNPKRLISSYTIDLAPLFKWWPKREGSRPLAAWVHITGSIVGTNAEAWIIDASVEGRPRATTNGLAPAGSSSTRIILHSPPVEELTEFVRWSTQLNAVAVQRVTLAGEAAQARERDRVIVERLHAARLDGAQYVLLVLEDQRLRKLEAEARGQLKWLDQRIQALNSRLASYPNADRYVVDCFALDLHYDHDRMPVFDYGRVLP